MLRRLPTDETALVRLAAECDDDAFSAIIERSEGHLRVTISKYADNREDREDLRSDVVAKLLHDGKRALRVWEPIAPFGAYLTTISVRHCLDWLRGRGELEALRVGQLPGDQEEAETDVIERIAPDQPSARPDALLGRSHTEQVLREALEQLSDDDRLVLALRFEEGLKGPAIARTLGISHNAARQRVFKALRRLERVLDEGAAELLEHI